ncbi:hypothetical protein [Tsukamurella tyrosinosolvens]|uniref:hypothetical protein n=1 Tax=Tsukamurella tyrosinosolvens TaxID=57704 RepID=UPI000C7E8FB7|nr:hypothetical protein [Tsukamurella tyrosinosolvens]AUN39977.1 hypothetical protein ASU32_08095 [Tsukamurella tyrosinosolvens]
MTDEDRPIPRWPLFAVLGLSLVFVLGVKAWDRGHEVGYGLLVVAGCVLIGCERIAVAIKGRERD